MDVSAHIGDNRQRVQCTGDYNMHGKAPMYYVTPIESLPSMEAWEALDLEAALRLSRMEM